MGTITFYFLGMRQGKVFQNIIFNCCIHASIHTYIHTHSNIEEWFGAKLNTHPTLVLTKSDGCVIDNKRKTVSGKTINTPWV